MTTSPDQLVGNLTAVASSWLRTSKGERIPLPLHVWLTVEGLGTRQLHKPGSGSIAILDDLPHKPYAVDEITATVEVEPGTPEVLGAKIGERIRATSLLWAEPPGEEVGFMLHFHDGDVGIANVADDLTVLAWPDPMCSKWGIKRMS